MNDDSQVEPSELAKRRIAYSAKVTELQYQQAKRICDEINGMPIGRDDPMVLAVLKAISTNYAAHATELRACASRRLRNSTARLPDSQSAAGQVKFVDPGMFDGEVGSAE